MGYTRCKITDDNKVIGLAVELGPKQNLNHFFTKMPEVEFGGWVKNLRADMVAARDAAGLAADAVVMIDIEIKHADGSLQYPGLEDLKHIFCDGAKE